MLRRRCVKGVATVTGSSFRESPWSGALGRISSQFGLLAIVSGSGKPSTTAPSIEQDSG